MEKQRGRLLSQNYSYIKPVRIDRCRKCYGIWIDDGELNQIIGQKKQVDEEYSFAKVKKFLRSVLLAIKQKEEGE